MSNTRHTTHDDGFTLVELLMVIVILGVLGTIVVMAVSDSATTANEAGCAADRRTLDGAVAGYFAVADTNTIVPIGAPPEGYEEQLVSAGVLRGTSSLHDLTAAGVVTPAAGSPCP